VLKVKADIHIHSLLSPCAEIEMSPLAIVQQAFSLGLKIIGITDHNSTLQCQTVKEIADEFGIYTLMGAEVTSIEEIHCLTYFDNFENLKTFQDYLETHIKKVKYNFKNGGAQAVLDAKNNVIDQITYHLGEPLDVSYEVIEGIVHSLDGIFIPAHIDRLKYSLISQLGFIPQDIKVDAFEIFNQTPLVQFLKENGHISQYSVVKNSDAHQIESIGKYYSTFYLEKISFNEIKMALRKKLDRMVITD
jgi:PHP family Zn ribbon phosphoesterase